MNIKSENLYLETNLQTVPAKLIDNCQNLGKLERIKVNSDGNIISQSVKNRDLKTAISEDSYPLSPMQQGMLFHHLVAQSGVDIEQMVCLVPEQLEVSAFTQAWQKVVARHPILRTSFDWETQDEPLQCVHQQMTIPLIEQDWRDLSQLEQSTQLQAYLQSDRVVGFQLNIAPLMRLALFRLQESTYQLVWTFHHAILDGRSMSVILTEVFAFYDAILQGEDLQLTGIRPYRDHIQWLQQQDWSTSQSFWQQLLHGFNTPTPLLVDPIPSQKDGFGTQEIRLSKHSTAILQALAQENQLTLNTLVQGAWALLLSRYSRENDVVFGATRACRHSSVAGAESMVGLLINTVPVRVNVSGSKALLTWLKELRSQWVAMRDYEHTPLVNIQSWSDVPKGTSLFNSLVVFENTDLNTVIQSQGDRYKNLHLQLEEQTNFPLTLIGCGSSELSLKLKYDQHSFNDAKIARMLGHLETLLSSMATNPTQCLGELPLLTVQEQMQLWEWNQTQADFSQQKCIHHLFEEQVLRTPDAVAVVFEKEQLTYYELNIRANQLAHHIKKLGVKPGVLVAVYLERSLEMIPAVLGILKAGGTYVPLEPSFPASRIELLLSSLQINCVVTQNSLLPKIQELAPQLNALQHLICLDRAVEIPGQVWSRDSLDLLGRENLPPSATEDDIAYVIFTSGSTGTPKGVVVRHQPVINLIEWVNKTFDVNADDRVLFITSLCFDLSVYDIFGLLAVGGSIRVVSSVDVRDPAALFKILCTEPITFWDSAPPALQQLATLFTKGFESSSQSQLRLVFMSGDWIPVTLPDVLKNTFPGVKVISLGGATEATVWSNYYPIAKVEPEWKSIPYGKPIQNAEYYILDSYLNPCPIGVTGELYIGGVCLASGYLHAEELTAQKFIPNPFSDNPAARLYKTGDLARYFSDGNIEFLGRIDHQVKVRGFRIELGEIESVLAQHQSVADTVILVQDDNLGHKRLVAYVVLSSECATSELRRFLQARLPEYMVPSVFIAIDQIPLTVNGKVDRRALKAPDSARPDLEKAFVAPRNTIELQLAEIWQQVLGIQPIGITDNFFDLGGQSLHAVRLQTQIQKKLGINLPLASFFQNPTIEKSALIIRTQSTSPQSTIVPLQPSGVNQPLFFINSITYAKRLISYLGSEQPFYGLSIFGLPDMDNQQLSELRIENIATQFIQDMRQIQPHGPYLLSAYCRDAYIAFEMAQQLQAQGEQVAMLALIDVIWEPHPLNLQFYLHNLRQFGFGYLWDKIKNRLETVHEGIGFGIKNLIGSFYSRMGSKLPRSSQDIKVLKAYEQAASNYVPQAYSGQVNLFLSSEWLLINSDKLASVVTGEFKTQIIPGTHSNLFKEPQLGFLGKLLRDCINTLFINQ